MSIAIYDKLLTDIAARCNVTDSSILRKSKELIALLNSKQFHCTEICKVVVCLELANNLSSSPVLKREEAIKYSGCKKSAYINIYNNISKLLNLDKIYSVKEVCLLVNASDVNIIANKLLQKYQKQHVEEDADFEHPMYACAAVLIASRNNNIRINLPKLVEISRIKKSELESLASQFEKLVDKKENVNKNSNKRNNFMNVAADHQSETEDKPKKEKTETEKTMTDEEYNEWKRRMLED